MNDKIIASSSDGDGICHNFGKNIDEPISKIVNEEHDPSLFESATGALIGALKSSKPMKTESYDRPRSCSLPSHTSVFSGNSSMLMSTALSMNGDEILLERESDGFNASSVIGSEIDKDEFEHESDDACGTNERHSSVCANGVFAGKFESLGSSFGSLLGIQTPVKIIDKTPDEHNWHLDSGSSANVPAVNRRESRRDSMSTKANETGSFRSAQTGQTPGNDSFSLSTIPFLPELTGDHRKKEGKIEPKLSYRTCNIYAHNIERGESLQSHNHESITSDLEELAKNGFSITQSMPSSFRQVNEFLQMASKFELEGKFSLALDYYGKCLDFYSRVKESTNFQSKHYVNMASLFHNVGVVHWKTGNYDESLQALKQARSEIDEAIVLCEEGEVQAAKEQLCDILNTRGRIFASKGDFDDALEQHSESLSILKSLFVDKISKKSSADLDKTKKTGVPDRHEEIETNQIESIKNENSSLNHPGIARALICMGSVHVSCGRLSVAMELFKGGLDIQRRTVGSKHVDVAATLNSIGSVYEKTGRHEKAMQCYKKSRQIYIKNLGEGHVDVAVTLNNIGQIYHHYGKYQKAIDSFRSALRIMKNVLGKTHRNVAATLYNMGLVHVQCCQYETAMKVFKETLLLQRGTLGDDHVDVALTLESIGGIYEHRLRIDRALDIYYKALSIRQRATRDHLFVAFAMDKIGKCQLNLNGDIKEAVLCFDEALMLYRANGIAENDPLIWEAKKNLLVAAKVLKKRKQESEDALIGLHITI